MTKRPFQLACTLTGLTLGVLACGGAESNSGEDAAAMAPPDTTPTVVATGLNGPMGVLADDAGNVWVVDSGLGGDDTITAPSITDGSATKMGYGMTARLVRVSPDGTQADMGSLPSLGFPEGPEGANRLAMANGELYVSSAGWSDGNSVDRLPLWAAVVRYADGGFTEVANTWDLEKSQNPEGALVETHTYGLAAGPDGLLWVTDAAGNDLLTVDPATGALTLKAVFGPYDGPIPNPNRGDAKEIEAVPTSVAFAGGNTYVSLLTGVPFLPGLSRVVQVNPDGTYTDYATGLTMLTDLKTGPDGNLYAISIGVFAEEGPQPATGALIRIMPGDSTSVEVVGGLTFPTAVAFNSAGDAYVTINGLGEPGSGQVMRYPGVAMPGM